MTVKTSGYMEELEQSPSVRELITEGLREVFSLKDGALRSLVKPEDLIVKMPIIQYNIQSKALSGNPIAGDFSIKTNALFFMYRKESSGSDTPVGYCALRKDHLGDLKFSYAGHSALEEGSADRLGLLLETAIARYENREDHQDRFVGLIWVSDVFKMLVTFNGEQTEDQRPLVTRESDVMLLNLHQPVDAEGAIVETDWGSLVEEQLPYTH